jgi:hypothetical protein
VTPPAAKPSGGELVVVVVGDSIADGVGADPTGNGADLLHYGGAAPIAGLSIYDDGNLLSAYQDSNGGAPDPGLLPHIGRAALAAGYSSVRILRWAVSGSSTATVRGTFWPAAVRYLAQHGLEPHLVVPVCGSNDSGTGEAAGFAAQLPYFYGEIEGAFPSARIVHVDPIAAAAGSYPESDLIRTAIHATVAAKPTRAYVPGAGLSGNDDVHPSLSTYSTQGVGVITAYLGTS